MRKLFLFSALSLLLTSPDPARADAAASGMSASTISVSVTVLDTAKTAGSRALPSPSQNVAAQAAAPQDNAKQVAPEIHLVGSEEEYKW